MKNIYRLPLLFTASIILALEGCALYQKPVSGASPMIKVLIHSGAGIVLRPDAGYIISFNSRKEAGEGPVTVELKDGALYLNGVALKTGLIEIYSGGSLSFEGRKYPGSMTISLSDKSLNLINVTDIETYLKGVLPGEVPAGWDAEALKAQAVVSRTFALYEVVSARKSGRLFDLYGDTRSQSYAGMDGEATSTSMAVDTTIGEVLRYEGKIIHAFFHSASGGMTESSSNAFGDYKPYLISVQSPYSSVYKDDKWKTSIPLDRASKLLGLTNRLASAVVTGRTDSLRIKTVEFSDTAGNKITLQGSNLRELIGQNLMKSTRANIKVTEDSLVISGAGYGHGVGMGQWDALGMARQGFSYRNILAYFYRGAAVDRIW